jgi:hypothetical protein
MTSKSVMILVMDAGGQTTSAFCSYNTVPVDASIRTADVQSKVIGATELLAAAYVGIASTRMIAVQIKSPATLFIPFRVSSPYIKNHLGTLYAPR